MYFLECFDGRRSPDRKAKTGYVWSALALGDEADRGYPTDDDPQLLDAVRKMLTHPMNAGVRIVFHTDRVKPVKIKPNDGDIVTAFAEGDLDASLSSDVRLA